MKKRAAPSGARSQAVTLAAYLQRCIKNIYNITCYKPELSADLATLHYTI